jgi:hypothetical protein
MSLKMRKSGRHRIMVMSCVGTRANASDAPVFMTSSTLLVSGKPSQAGSMGGGGGGAGEGGG